MQIEPGKSYLLEGEVLSLQELLKIEELKDLANDISAIDRITIEERNPDIATVRQTISALSQKPFGKYRLFYMQYADELSDNIQNTLLKFLEEPPSYLILIIHASHSERLLVTILSRLTKLNTNNVPGLGKKFPDKFLEDYGVSEKWFEKIKRDEAIITLKYYLSEYKHILLERPEDEIIQKVMLLENLINRLEAQVNQKLAVHLFLLNWFKN